MESNIKGCYQKLKVLYVEDDRFSREKLLRILERRFADVLVAADGEEGFLLYQQKNPEIIIVDIKLDKRSSLEMIEKIRQQDSNVQIIVTTANDDSELLLQLMDHNINHFILKPIDLEKFLFAVQKSVVHVEMEKRLAQQKEFNSLLINFQENIIFVSENEQVIEANRAFWKFTGLDSSQVISTESLGSFFITDSHYFSPTSQQVWLEEFIKIENGTAKVKWRSADGSIRIFLMKATLISDEKRFIFVCTDITKLEAEYRKNEFLVHLDPMTRGYNRLKFSDILTSEIEEAKQTSKQFSVILLDIDNFQRINDQFGYDLGDEVLSTLATIIQQRIGESDVFGRWSGKEFILLIPEYNLQAAAELAESIRSLISGFHFEGIDSITCSFGISQFLPGKSKNQLLKEVDHALLLSKLKGKDCVTTFQNQENENKVGVLGV